MKNKILKPFIFCFAVFFFLSTAVISQDNGSEKGSVNPTDAAKESFLKSFPGSTNVKWEKEDKDYEVNFLQNKKSMSAIFTQSGELKETEIAIKAEELPVAAVKYMNSHYKGMKIAEASKVTKPKGEVNYEARVNKTDLVFNEDGKFIRTEKE